MASVQGGLVLVSPGVALAALPAGPSGIGAPNVVAAGAAAPVPVGPSTPAQPAPGVVKPPLVVSPVERAKLRARAERVEVVVEELTSERSVTTARPDGTFQTEVSVEPVRFRDAAGVWRGLDAGLVADGLGRLRPRSAPVGAARVAQTTGSGPVVEVGEGAGLFSWRLEGAAPGRSGQVGAAAGPGSASSVRYGGVLPGGRDLLLAVQPGRVKESVVLPDRAAGLGFPSYTDVFTVPVGVSARQGVRGVEFVDAAGVVLAEFGGGHAFDSTADAVGEPVTAPVSTRLVAQTGRSVTVTVGVEPAWLADSVRVFPVTIDPDFYANTNGGGFDAYVDEAFPTTTEGSYDSGRLKTGFRSVNGVNRPAETLLQFGLPAELTNYDNNVLSSTLSVYNEYSSSCDRADMPPVVVRSNAGPWDARAVTWNTRPGVWDPWTSKKFAFGYSSACAAAWADIDVRPQVQEWSNGRPNYGFRLWVESGLTFGYKRFKPAESGAGSAPALRVTWENCSVVPGGPTGPRKVCGAIRDTWWALGAGGVGVTDHR